MIRWGEPVYLWLLAALPLLAGLLTALTLAKRRRLGRLVATGLLPRLTPAHARWLEHLRNALMVLALGFLLLAAARPRWGEQLQLYRGRGIDVVIALDASRSMLAEDVKPNRLARAKAELSALLDDLRGNAVGIVAFAGEALVLCPMTTDVDAARLFLDIIDPAAMPVPGTDYGKAIEAALDLFNPEENTHKALVFVTDGEDHGRHTARAVQRAAETGVRIFPVAFATPDGAPIPEYDERGGLRGYVRDRQGDIVISRMDERALIAIARATEGRFLRVDGFSSERLVAELDRIRKKEIGGGEFVEYVERYQSFLIIALVLFIAALATNDRRGGWLHRKKKPSREDRGLGVLLLAGLLLAGSAQASVPGLMRRGNGLFARGRYEEALAAYQRAVVLEPDASAIRFNTGNALHRLGRYDEALRELELALADRNPARRADALYNIGNTFYRAGQLEQAIAAYRAALLENPDDLKAKQNLEFCLERLEEQQQPQPDDGEDETGPEDQPRPEPDEQALDPDQAERMMQALERLEREQQERQHQPRRQRQVEIDW